MGVGFILCFLFGIDRPSKSSQSCLLIFKKMLSSGLGSVWVLLQRQPLPANENFNTDWRLSRDCLVWKLQWVNSESKLFTFFRACRLDQNNGSPLAINTPCLFFVLLKGNQEKERGAKTFSDGSASSQKHFGTHQCSRGMNSAVRVCGQVGPIYVLLNDTRKLASVKAWFPIKCLHPAPYSLAKCFQSW